MKIIKQVFRANRPVRWTVIAVATTVLVAVVPVVAQIQFSDVPDDNIHRDDINFVAGERWFVGYRDGTYQPDREISENEMAKVLSRAFAGLTRAEFASFMVAGNEYLKAVKNPLPNRWDPFGDLHENEGGTITRLYVIGHRPGYVRWTDDGGNYFIEPGQYRIEGFYDSDNRGNEGERSSYLGSIYTRRKDWCRWMRLGYIPEGGQNFDTIAATDAPLAGYFQNEYTNEAQIMTILPTDTAFVIQCAAGNF